MRLTRAGRVAALGAALTLSSVTLAAGVANAADPPAVNPQTVISDKVKPGVQLIQTQFGTTLSVPQSVLNDRQWRALLTRVEVDAILGRISNDSTSKINAIVTAISEHPLTYLIPGSGTPRTTSASLTGVGTGWVVTPDGYIVTAAHVVSPSAAELKTNFARTALSAFNQKDA